MSLHTTVAIFMFKLNAVFEEAFTNLEPVYVVTFKKFKYVLILHNNVR